MSGGDPGSGADGAALAKADPALRRVLEEAPPGERPLRVVLVLHEGGGGEAPGGAPGSWEDRPEGRRDPADRPGGKTAPPSPADFPDRIAWRRAMVEHRRRRMEAGTGETRRALEGLGLEVRGGAAAAVVVVDGPPALLRRALALPGVRRGTLDRVARPGRGAPGPESDG